MSLLGPLPPDTTASRRLLHAAEAGDAAEVRRQLQAGADPNFVDSGRHPWTALMFAARHGHADAVRALLDAGGDPNREDLDGFAALGLACAAGHADVAEQLAERGADLARRDATGRSALDYCRRRLKLAARLRELAARPRPSTFGATSSVP